MCRIRAYRTPLKCTLDYNTILNKTALFAKKHPILAWKWEIFEYNVSLKPLKFNRTPMFYRRDYGSFFCLQIKVFTLWKNCQTAGSVNEKVCKASYEPLTLTLNFLEKYLYDNYSNVIQITLSMKKNSFELKFVLLHSKWYNITFYQSFLILCHIDFEMDKDSSKKAFLSICSGLIYSKLILQSSEFHFSFNVHSEFQVFKRLYWH